MATEGAMQVTVVWSPSAQQVLEWKMELAPGACVRDAVRASGLVASAPDLDVRLAGIGVWGRAAGWDQALRDGDRVEVYRALKVDPKVARRERFRTQGARAAGLFAKSRPGGKAGY